MASCRPRTTQRNAQPCGQRCQCLLKKYETILSRSSSLNGSGSVATVRGHHSPGRSSKGFLSVLPSASASRKKARSIAAITFVAVLTVNFLTHSASSEQYAFLNRRPEQVLKKILLAASIRLNAIMKSRCSWTDCRHTQSLYSSRWPTHCRYLYF